MFNKKLRLVEDSYRTFALEEDLVYKGKYDTFVVPAGFVTDFASVPQFMSWLIPSYGQYTKAAIVHDWLCVKLREWYELGGTHRPNYVIGITPEDTGTLVNRPVTSVDTDGIFRRIMRELGVPPVRRWLIWAGVRWGAIANPARRPGSLKTLPKLIGISLLALPFVLVPSIFVGIVLLIDKVVEKL